MDINFYNNLEIEFDEAYSEIEFILSQADSDDDPFNNNVLQTISWPSINTKCQILLAKGLDFRVLLWKLRADLNSQGFSGLWECFRILEQAFTLLHEDELNRLNAAMSLSWLTGGQCLSTVKAAKLIPNLSIVFDQFQQSPADSANAVFANNFSEQVTMLGNVNDWFINNNLPTLKEQLQDGLRILDAITQRINSLPDGILFDPFRLRNYLQIKLKSLLKIDHSISDVENPAAGLKNASESPSAQQLNQRSEAVLMLDNVLAYFDKHEPSHPAPVLILRAKKMIGMDFAEIIQELLPEAVESLQQFAGKS
ncbi:type VI secretion system ImpA family N-terminal domain-containing protein (plasmid) [Pantoea dispersa]|uniref:type VI secretion system protein TssA n=1 Tax=Pantoea dispersa TaxID=59814 RepID=UPI001CA79F6C|nr:type VI secretion system ImpA family N-terminal domain-containing protein [Pantoea dispersa]QZY93061.1 type VI secretion system ImpA family N-terminal domain-containing protein [Pantoea dispersa]